MTTSNSTPIYTILTDVTATMLGADVLRLIVRLESALTTELTRGSSGRKPVETASSVSTHLRPWRSRRSLIPGESEVRRGGVELPECVVRPPVRRYSGR
jgi:hypothetical protein